MKRELVMERNVERKMKRDENPFTSGLRSRAIASL